MLAVAPDYHGSDAPWPDDTHTFQQRVGEDDDRRITFKQRWRTYDPVLQPD
jgi:hypothetical protein